MYNSVQPHRRQPTRLPRPWDSPGKNTGVGCHFLLQCRKVKSESEVAQLCPTLPDPMDCSLPGSSVPGILRARILEWVAMPSFRGSSNPGIGPGSPSRQANSLPAELPGNFLGDLFWFFCVCVCQKLETSHSLNLPAKPMGTHCTDIVAGAQRG